MGTIAIFGGSFDPIHVGHLSVASQVAEKYAVDRLWFMPASVSPLKRGMMSASDEDRLAMLRLAIEGNDRFAVSDYELRKGGVSFTVDTVAAWREANPQDRIVFLAGMDSLLTLSRWKDWARLVEMCRFVTFIRPGCEIPMAETLGLPLPLAHRLLADVFEGSPSGASSTEVRARVAQALPIDDLVPPAVAKYIKERNLYCKAQV